MGRERKRTREEEKLMDSFETCLQLKRKTFPKSFWREAVTVQIVRV